MTRSRQTNRDSLHGSDSSEEDSDERSPPRGRSGKEQTQEEGEDEKQVDAQTNGRELEAFWCIDRSCVFERFLRSRSLCRQKAFF